MWKRQNLLKGWDTEPVPVSHKKKTGCPWLRTAGFSELTVYEARCGGQIRQHKVQVDRQQDQEIDQYLFPEIIFLLHIRRWLHRHPPILSSRYVWCPP